MATDFKLPELGENVAAGDVLRILVKPGDTLAKEQPVLELETDKATIEVPSSVAGVVADVKVKLGDKVKVGQTILTVDEGAGAAAPAPAPASQPAAASPAAPAAAATAEAAARQCRLQPSELPKKMVRQNGCLRRRCAASCRRGVRALDAWSGFSHRPFLSDSAMQCWPGLIAARCRRGASAGQATSAVPVQQAA